MKMEMDTEVEMEIVMEMEMEIETETENLINKAQVFKLIDKWRLIDNLYSGNGIFVWTDSKID